MAGLSYTIPVNWGPITSIQPYIDYSMVDKDADLFHDTHFLIPGMLITAGPVFAYVDYAMGKNQPWLTDTFGKGLGSGIETPIGTADSTSTWVTIFKCNPIKMKEENGNSNVKLRVRI